jgi:two-component system response regulator YesN
MYSVLIVDDEAIELETVEKYVPWDKMGFTVAGTARNGKEALSKLAELKPDIILTDVRMPIMDGLEFGRRAKQFDKNVKVIYLSGHNEFQYIKAALNIEAAGYLLKPIDMEELIALMEKVKKKCDEEQQAGHGEDWLKEKMLVRIVHEADRVKRGDWIRRWELSVTESAVTRDFSVACVTFDTPVAYPAEAARPSVNLDFLDRTELLRSIVRKKLDRFVLAEAEPNVLYLWFQWQDSSGTTAAESVFWERFREQLATSFESQITIGLSEPYTSFDRIWDACRQARACNDEKFYKQGGAVIVPTDLKPTKQTDEDLEQMSSRLVSAIQSGDAEQVRQQIEALFATIREDRIDRNYAVRAVIRLLSALEQHFSVLLADLLVNGLLVVDWKEISAMSTCSHIQAYVMHFCEELMKVASERDVDRNQAVTDRIVRLIAERYRQPLTVEDIAKEVYLSPNYTRTIFKEKTGETILDYLTKVRINRAADLLKDKSRKVREVAHAVGYENVSYFCSIFHKHRGQTPNEYRKMFL